MTTDLSSSGENFLRLRDALTLSLRHNEISSESGVLVMRAIDAIEQRTEEEVKETFLDTARTGTTTREVRETFSLDTFRQTEGLT